MLACGLVHFSLVCGGSGGSLALPPEPPQASEKRSKHPDMVECRFCGWSDSQFSPGIQAESARYETRNPTPAACLEQRPESGQGSYTGPPGQLYGSGGS